MIAIRKLPSGDSHITFTTETARNAWLKDTTWLSVYGVGARVKRRSFIILAHGIKINQIQTQDQEKIKTTILQQNPSLKRKIEILRVG